MSFLLHLIFVHISLKKFRLFCLMSVQEELQEEVQRMKMRLSDLYKVMYKQLPTFIYEM